MNTLFALEPMESRRLLSSGQLDPTFGNAGRIVDAGVNADHVDVAAVGSDGKIVVAGSVAGSSEVFIERYTTGGAPDPAFNGGAPVELPLGTGAISELRVLPDGRIEFVSGSLVGRLQSGGALDPTLNPGSAQPGTEVIQAPGGSGVVVSEVAIQPDGKF